MRTVFIQNQLPGWLTLTDRDDLVEKVRETALPELMGNGRILRITWEAPTDWELRGAVQETLDVIEAEFSVSLYGLDLNALMPGDA